MSPHDAEKSGEKTPFRFKYAQFEQYFHDSGVLCS